MKRRRGYTLFETLVGLSAGSVVLTVAALGVHRAMMFQSEDEAVHRDEAAAWRLSSDLRRDLRSSAAIDVERRDGPCKLRLVRPDEAAVTYVFRSDRVDRTKGVVLESYAFSTPVDWAVERFETPIRVRVTVAAPSARPRNRLNLTIEGHAALAREASP